MIDSKAITAYQCFVSAIGWGNDITYVAAFYANGKRVDNTITEWDSFEEFANDIRSYIEQTPKAFDALEREVVHD